jgi:hypothetical protein
VELPLGTLSLRCASVTSVYAVVSPLAGVRCRIRKKIKELKGREGGGAGVNWEGRFGRRCPAIRREGAVTMATWRRHEHGGLRI